MVVRRTGPASEPRQDPKGEARPREKLLGLSSTFPAAAGPGILQLPGYKSGGPTPRLELICNLRRAAESLSAPPHYALPSFRADSLLGTDRARGFLFPGGMASIFTRACGLLHDQGTPSTEVDRDAQSAGMLRILPQLATDLHQSLSSSSLPFPPMGILQALERQQLVPPPPSPYQG